jgi:hypothetical protein
VFLLTSTAGFAQRSVTSHIQPINSIDPYMHISPGGALGKSAGIGGRDTLHNIADTSVLTLYTLGLGSNDSGYVNGTNIWNDMAFAERYDFNGADSSVQVIGVLAQFGGKVNPASALTVNFNVWNIGLTAANTLGASMSYNGFPNNIVDSFAVPVTQLGIGATKDTMKVHLFSSPSASLSGSFFVGYSINYNFSTLNGDNIGLACSRNGDRKSSLYSIQVNFSYGDTLLDTVINVQNATMFSDYNWYDNYTQNDSLKNDLAIYPIVIIGGPTSIKGITRNNLTFFGNYPNPAVNNTYISFSLSNSADVTVQIMDITGRTINTIKQPSLIAGDHIIPVNTTNMPAGDYLYLIHTSSGDGMAGKMTIVK